MKMTKNDYTRLENRINGYLLKHHADWHLRDTRDKKPMRYRWNLYHLTDSHDLQLHTYLNDDHIDTALRKITGTPH